MNDGIAFACVVWNDAERLRPLLEHVRPYFKTLAIAVQESPDDTLAVARELADIVVTDDHHGFGDASFGPKLLPAIKDQWTFKVDADEWPTERLLQRLGDIRDQAARKAMRGAWIPFRSWVDEVEWEEDHSHLRLFMTYIGWKPTLHSRPMIDDTLQGLSGEEYGYIEHRRSLDEMMRDYLNYYRIGRGNEGWDKHNRAMMRGACEGAASRMGWDYVKSFEWWPDVKEAAFDGKEPPMVIYCSGPSCSGTRLLFDMVRTLGLTAVHATMPGYYDKPDGGLDTDNPNWWPVEEWVSRFGPGKWVVMSRDPAFASQCALERRFIKSIDEYPEFRRRSDELLAGVPAMDSYRLSYESLVADPQGEYDKLADWLGVDHQEIGPVFDGNQRRHDATKKKRAPRKTAKTT